MRIDVKLDEALLRAGTERECKQLAYNVAAALNKTALATQVAIREQMQKDFTLRKTNKRDRSFLLEQIKVNFASARQAKPYAEVYVADKPRLLLALFETGGQRAPFVGKDVAVPVDEVARAGGTRAGAMKQELTFKELRLHGVRVTPMKQQDDMQFKGAQRTFLLKSTAQHPEGGIFQRIGPGKDDIRMVYSFHKAFVLRRLLHLFETAEREMREKFATELHIAYAGAPLK